MDILLFIAAGVLIGWFLGRRLDPRIAAMHKAYCRSQQHFVDASNLIDAVEQDLRDYHSLDDDRIGVAMVRISKWRHVASKEN